MKVFSKYDFNILASEKTIKVILIIFISISLFLRFYRLNDVPPDLEGDAYISGMHALKISDNLNLDSLFPMAASYFWLYAPWHIILGILFRIFCVSKLTMTIMSNSISLLTVMFIFIAAKKLFGKRSALLSIYFALISLWYITYSRYALSFVTIIPLYFLITLYVLFLYDEEKKIKYLFFAGLLLGAGWLNGYPHIISILPIFVVYKIWREHNALCVFNWRYLLFVLIGIAIYFAGIIAIAKLYRGNSLWIVPKTFQEHFLNYKVADLGVFNMKLTLPAIKANICNLFKVFFVSAEERHNPGFACLKVLYWPLISPMVAIFLCIGIIKSFWRRKAIDKLLLSWIFIPFVIYLLTVEKVCSRYFLGVFPAVCLLAGREVDSILKWIYKKFTSRVAGIIGVLSIIIIGACGLFELYDGYFVHYAGNDCNLHRNYGMELISCDINSRTKNDLDSIVVFGDEVLVPNFNFHFYTKGKFISRCYYWKDFVDIYNKNKIELSEKKVYLIFSNPDDPKVEIFGRESKLKDFNKYFPNNVPLRVVRYQDKTKAKILYMLEL